MKLELVVLAKGLDVERVVLLPNLPSRPQQKQRFQNAQLTTATQATRIAPPAAPVAQDTVQTKATLSPTKSLPAKQGTSATRNPSATAATPQRHHLPYRRAQGPLLGLGKVWSMEAFVRIELDPATKRPRLEAEEIELTLTDGVRVLSDDKQPVLDTGVARLTTHRLCWVNLSYTAAWSLSHARVASLEAHMSGLLGMRKTQIKVTTVAQQVLRVEFDVGRDNVLQQWHSALTKREWEKKLVVKEEFSASGAGISGLLRKVEQRSASEAKALNEAFSDLDALGKAADELVRLAKRLQKAARTGAEGSEAGAVLADLGIVPAVTRESCGSLFHEELARSLCQFLLSPAAKAALLRGGMASLTDVYCAYNRARGTALISPEDLLGAALMMEQLDLPLRLKDFESGVRVLELRGEENSAKERIAALFSKEQSGIAVHEVAERLGISMAVALEQLLLAEERRLLCRDETVRGLAFFRNVWCK